MSPPKILALFLVLIAAVQPSIGLAQDVPETVEDERPSQPEATTQDVSEVGRDDESSPEGDGAQDGPAGLMAYVERPDEDFTIVEVRLPRLILSDGLPAYWDEERLHLPLLAVVDLLEFPIEVDVEAGTARGWFLAEDRTFRLSLERGTVTLSGEEHPIDAPHVQRHVDDIYVDLETLQQWFPLTLTFAFNDLRVNLVALEPLPMERRLQREKYRANLLRTMVEEGPRYEIVSPPYTYWTPPVYDLRLSVGLPTQGMIANRADSSGAIAQSNSYLARGAGDLLYMNGTWYVTGNEVHPLSGASLRLERKDPNGKILGYLEATEVAVGDVPAAAIPLVSRWTTARGTSLSNFPLTRPSAFDHTVLHGESSPGWEVELYRNGALIDFQVVSEDGLYFFDDIPVGFGRSELKLIFYGPYGEKREETHHYVIGPGMIRPGKRYYRATVTQHDRMLVDVRPNRVDQPETGKIRFTGEYEHGIFEHLAIASQVATIPLRDSQRFYTSLGLRGFFQRVYGTLDAIADIGKGFAAQGAINTRVSEVEVAASHTQLFQEFASEHFPVRRNALRGQSRLRLNGRLGVPYDHTLIYSLQWETNFLEESQLHSRLNKRLSMRLFDFHVANQLNLGFRPEVEASVHGTVTVRRRFREYTPQASMTYRRDGGVSRVGVGTTARLKSNLIANGGIDYHRMGLRQVVARVGLDHRREHFTIGGTTTYGSRGGFSIGVTVGTSVGWNTEAQELFFDSRSLTNSGVVMPRVFWDLDQDGVFGHDDEAIAEASFIVNQRRHRDSLTDDDGVAVVRHIPVHTYANLEVDPRSLYDPFFVAVPKGRTVITRPGVVTVLDFPVVMSGEVDGTVYRRHGEGIMPAGRIKLRLLDEGGNVVAETASAYDGFYLFDFVLPGDYIVDVDPEQLRQLRMASPDAKPVAIGVSGTVVSGQDFIVEAAVMPKGDGAVPPEEDGAVPSEEGGAVQVEEEAPVSLEEE